jgi:hypothetical protein
MESRFIRIAFSGSTIERSITISTTNERARMKAMIRHIEPEIWSLTSLIRAAAPPTPMRARCARAEEGAMVSRIGSTTDSECGDSFEPRGVI